MCGCKQKLRSIKSIGTAWSIGKHISFRSRATCIAHVFIYIISIKVVMCYFIKYNYNKNLSESVYLFMLRQNSNKNTKTTIYEGAMCSTLKFAVRARTLTAVFKVS